MKTLVVYTSKNGYTLECAKKIGEGLRENGHEADLKDAKKEARKADLSQYDSVIIGGGIHAGQLPGAVRRYCAANEAALRTKRLGLFICGTDVEHQEKQFSDNYPQSLLDVAVAKGWFGGRIVFAEQSAPMRFMLKKILKGAEDVHEERIEAVGDFLNRLISG
jgi:menaquinone-dependent protoporphyrinogen oxidase